MFARIAATEHNALLVPPQTSAHIGHTVPQRQTATPAVGVIGLGAVQQQVGVDRHFAGTQFVFDRHSILLSVVDRLIEHVVFFGGAGPISQMSKFVRPGEEPHAAVPDIGIINRQPHGDRLRAVQWPVTCILMSGHSFAIVRHLAKEVRAPADDVRAQQILHIGNDPRIAQNVVHSPMLQVSTADGIAITAAGERL